MTKEGRTFINRRNQLFETLEDNAIAFISGGSLVTRSHDTEYPFRQNSNFAYLMDLEEPDCILVLSKIQGTKKTILFLREKDELMEQWNGRRLGTKDASQTLEISEAYDIETFQIKLKELLPGHHICYSDYFCSLERHTQIMESLKSLMNWRKKKQVLPLQFKYIPKVIEKMRLVKGEQELKILQKSASIAHRAHVQAMSMAKEGVTEFQIQAAMEYIYKFEGANGSAYGAIVASGNDANILHYVENNKTLKNGDLILIDSGAEYKNYASDVTRTFPVSGKFSKEQKEVYEAVLDVQNRAIALCAPGLTPTKIHEFTCRELSKKLIELKVLKEDLEVIIEKELYKKYYPHGTGHWLGIDVHDQNPYLDESLNDITLAEGMVFTIEPGLYFPENDQNVPEEYRGIGIRIEDDIAITKDGYLNLTSSIPKTIQEIEEACAKEVSLEL